MSLPDPGTDDVAQRSDAPSALVIFGETLFDCFPDGLRVLGGAPFNVARTVTALGRRARLLTRIGDDEAGRAVSAALDAFGMNDEGVQIDEHRSTGAVRVAFSDGEPQYHIREGQAFDFVDAVRARDAACGATWLYHGSLALRSATNRQTLDDLRAITPRRFVDLNLRAPFDGDDVLLCAIEGATVLKLNGDEAKRTARALGLSSDDDPLTATRELHDALEVERIVLTLGEDGLVLFHPGGVTPRAHARPEILVDPVGAGDAVSAVVLCGLMEGWPDDVTAERAAVMAAAVCGLRGATATEQRFYDRFKDAWG